MTRIKNHRDLTIHLEHLEPAAAAWLIDFCGQLQAVLWHTYGDDIEVYWETTEPGQPIYGSLLSATRQKR